MNLSKRLTFSIFFILLVAALVVAPTAMAQVSVTVYKTTTPADDSAEPKVIGKIVYTFTYSETPDPRPDLSHFTATDNVLKPNDDDSERDVLTATYSTDGTNSFTAAVGGSGTEVTLTLTGSSTADPLAPSGFELKGYSTDLFSLTSSAIDSETAVPLNLIGGYIGGKTYVVYIRGTDVNTAVTSNPTILPSYLLTGADNTVDPSFNSQVVRTLFIGLQGSVEGVTEVPDLEEFFNDSGGTIDLVVATTDNSADQVIIPDAGNLDLIINEIMWGVDESKVGQDGYTHQQWIEVYNPKTTPVRGPKFVFTPGDGSSYAPAKAIGVVDRISNIAGVQNVWNNPRIKGSNGTAIRSDATGTPIIGANPPFTSIYRNKQDGDGTNADHWTASTRAYFPGFLGTPGAANTRGGFPGTRNNPTAYTPPKDKVIINEVGNYSDAASDWIELRNVSDAEQNINNWRLTYAREDDTDDPRKETEIIKFPEIKIPAGEVLLIVAAAPADTDLAEGFNIQIDEANQRRGYGPHKYRILTGLNIPAITDGFLILRSNHQDKFLKGRGHLHDAVGSLRVEHNTVLDLTTDDQEPESGNMYWKTNAWPINGHSGNDYRMHNADGSNNNNASLNPAANLADGTVWERIGTNHGWRKDGGKRAVFTGGIGYDRGVNKGGTPGYHNDVVKNVIANLDGGQLVISELMLTTDSGRYPQWIELHNTSKTRGIDLAADGSDPKVGWRMIVENHNSGKWATAREDKTVVTINLKDLFTYIPPNQTVLIVSDNARNSGTNTKIHFPSHRVASIWDTKKTDFLMESRRDIFLNAKGGFYIKIMDANDVVSDEVGNLDGRKADVRAGVPYDDPFGWNWPTDMANRNQRTSLIRLRNADGTPRAGTPIRPVAAVDDDPATDADETVAAVTANESRGAVLPMETKWRGKNTKVGTGGEEMLVWSKYKDYAWVHAIDAKIARAQATWYGTDTDHGTPGHTSNTPLPVELSFFRPTALEDGNVVIQWTTESELNNAGFNILRSDSRDGEFKQVNEQMIQGKGTTGERSTYKWIDTTAKLGAVYYYQIEDVSFAGERQTLATTKLKGLISARNKLSTIWGTLKSQD